MNTRLAVLSSAASRDPSLGPRHPGKVRKSVTFWREGEDDLGVDRDRSASVLKDGGQGPRRDWARPRVRPPHGRRPCGLVQRLSPIIAHSDGSGVWRKLPENQCGAVPGHPVTSREPRHVCCRAEQGPSWPRTRLGLGRFFLAEGPASRPHVREAATALRGRRARHPEKGSGCDSRRGDGNAASFPVRDRDPALLSRGPLTLS